MKYLLILTLLITLSACNSSNAVNSSVKPLPEIKPSPSPDIELNTPKEAIESFLKSKYDGWMLKGDTLDKGFNDLDENTSAQFDVHLEKGKENKVVKLMLKRFQNSEGKFYWLVYEATKLELSQIELNKLKKEIADEQFKLGIEEGTSNPNHY